MTDRIQKLRDVKRQLKEKVEIRHDRFERSHGKKAKGNGNWMFTTKSMGSPSKEEMVSARGTLAAAAKEAADKLGSTFVYVMEELEEGTSYEKDLNPNKRIVARGVKGMKSKPFTKKFKNMAAYDKWTDSDEYGDYDVQQLFNEAKGSEFKTNSLGAWKTNAKSRGLVVRAAVHPDKGEDGIYYTASDKQGNFRGEFFVDKKEGVLVEEIDSNQELSLINELSKATLKSYLKKTKDKAKDLQYKADSAKSNRAAAPHLAKRDKTLDSREGARLRLKGFYKPKTSKYHAEETGKQKEWDAAARGNQNPKDPRVEAYHDMAASLRKMSKEKLADLYRKRKAKDEKSKDPVTMGEWQAIKDAVVRVFKSLKNISEHHLKPGTTVTAKEGGKTIKGKVLFDTSDEDGTDSYQYVLNVGGKRVSVSNKSIQETKHDASWGTIYEL